VTAEIAIRGGTVVDGTGGPAQRIDVGIAGGRVVALEKRVRAPVELDASGRLVVPGFIDIHTHYDPQVLWDPALTPSSWHGVTSVVAGNCGYSLAPTTPAGRTTLLRTLDKVEDMRLQTLEAGIDWDFETYPEYLDAVRRRGVAVNFGGYVGHTAVRLYVMGEASYEREATDDEIGAMRQVIAGSITGGALGFSTDRAGFHLGDGGRPVPSIVASQAETEALAAVVGELGRGMVHVAPGENFGWVYDLQRRLGRRVTWSSIITYPPMPSRADFRSKLAHHLTERSQGADVWVQVTCRPILQQVALHEPTAFYTMDSFKEFVALEPVERRRLYADLDWRVRVQHDIDKAGMLATRWDTMTIVESPSQPSWVGRAVGKLAAERGASPWNTLCDLAVDDDLATRVEITFANDDAAGIAELIRGDGCVLGLSDAGAHVDQICDAVLPTDFLAHWVRDRDLMPVEQGVRKLTSELAGVVGIDRGRLSLGAPADVVVVDLDRLDPGPLRRVGDLPAGGERLVADRPAGVDHVLVNGVVTRAFGEVAGDGVAKRPGRVLTAG
jgi:N-acyl-D-amino-acid deacylase